MTVTAKSTTPKKHKDLFATPQYIFDRFQVVSGLTFLHDVCAQKWSSKCSSYWTKRNNALRIDWAKEFDPLTPLWMNPPYSDLPTWTEKAAQAAADGLIVTGLVPDSRSSAWYRNNVDSVATNVFLPDGRINFIRPDGTIAPSNPWPSCFPVWTPWACGLTSYPYFFRKE